MNYVEAEQNFLKSITDYEVYDLIMSGKGPIRVSLKSTESYFQREINMEVSNNRVTIDSHHGVYVFKEMQELIRDMEFMSKDSLYTTLFEKCVSVPKGSDLRVFSQEAYLEFVEEEISKDRYMSKTKQFLKIALIKEKLPQSLEEAYVKLHDVSDVCKNILTRVPPFKKFSFSYVWNVNAICWIFENVLKSTSDT